MHGRPPSRPPLVVERRTDALPGSGAAPLISAAEPARPARTSCCRKATPGSRRFPRLRSAADLQPKGRSGLGSAAPRLPRGGAGGTGAWRGSSTERVERRHGAVIEVDQGREWRAVERHGGRRSISQPAGVGQRATPGALVVARLRWFRPKFRPPDWFRARTASRGPGRGSPGIPLWLPRSLPNPGRWFPPGRTSRA
ncbi:MAG: hypothetical protein QOF30_2370 [Acidimicrobiaceae bacterium]|nr:hypothetical protein [Acidimicrobiaceae bacterium]